MPELTEEEMLRFIRTDAPIQFLLESGFSEEEAREYLWHFDGEQLRKSRELYPKVTQLPEGVDSLEDAGVRAIYLWGKWGSPEREEAIRHYADDPLAPWVFVRWICASYQGSYARAEMTRAYLELFGERIVAPLVRLALDYEYGDLLFAFAGEIGQGTGAALMVEHLASTKKQVIEGAIKGLVAAGKSATPHLLPLLQARQKKKRLSAAKVLVQTGDPAALSALQEAVIREKTDEGRRLLLNAVYACSGDDKSLEGRSVEELEAALKSIPPMPIPDFLDVDALPPLAWGAGEPLSKEATLGWLYLLACESEDTPCQQLRAFRSKLDPDALDAFGEAPAFRQEAKKAPAWVSFVPLIAVSEYKMREGFRRWDREPPFFRHGGRMAAMWLHSEGSLRAHLPKVKAKVESALEMLAPDVEPTSEELALFREEMNDLLATPNADGYFSWQTQEQSPITPAHCRRVDRHLFEDFTWHVFPSSFPELGQPLVAWGLALLPYPDGDFPADFIDLLKDHRSKLKSNIARLVEASLERFRWRTSARWTGWAWRQLFWGKPAWRLTATSLLFVAEEGSPFMLSPDGTCVDVEGHAVTFSKELFVSLVDVGTLSHDQRDAWERRYKALQEEWLASQPEDMMSKLDVNPLARLRDALSREPSTRLWDSICRIIDSFPDDESFQIAADYLVAHIDERWDGLELSAPESWWRPVLGLEQPIKEAEETATSYHDKCLPASNTIQLRDVAIEEAQATRLLQGDWSFVRGLVLGKVWLAPEALALLEGKCLFPALRSLTIYSNDNLEKSEQRDAELALARAFSNHPYEELRSHWELDREQAEALVSMGLFDGVKHLSFHNRLISAPVLQVLDQCEGLKDLRKLSIGFSFDNDSFCFFAQECSFPRLETISLYGWERFSTLVQYKTEAFEALARSHHFPNLKHILFEKFVLGHEKMAPKKEWLDALLASQTLPKELLDNLRAEYPHLLD